MDNQDPRLQSLLPKQREKIDELERENMRLKGLTDTLSKRICELEDKQRVIDSAIIDIPIVPF